MFIEETEILRENGLLELWEPKYKPSHFSLDMEELWWSYEESSEPSESSIKNRIKSWLWFVEQSNKEGASPFTDKPIYYEYLKSNYSRRFKDGIQRSQKPHGFLKDSASELAVRVLENHLPRFDCKSFEDVLELRMKLKDSIDRFRNTMMMYASKVKNTPWDEGFLDEIYRIMAAEVEPAIAELRDEAEAIRYRKTSAWIKSAISLKPLPILATTFIGVPIEISMAIAVGAITIETYLENKQLSKSIDNNGFSLLLKV